MILCEKPRRTHPLKASGTNFEVIPGPSRFQVRAREAMFKFTHGGLRIEADCSTDGPWADCGLHFGHPAT
eukprot:2902425-Alexandrium_andersonii.AAC.1